MIKNIFIIFFIGFLFSCSNQEIVKNDIQDSLQELGEAYSLPRAPKTLAKEYINILNLNPLNSDFRPTPEVVNYLEALWREIIKNPESKDHSARLHYLLAKLHAFDKNTDKSYDEILNALMYPESEYYYRALTIKAGIDFDKKNYDIAEEDYLKTLSGKANENIKINSTYMLARIKYQKRKYNDSIFLLLKTLKIAKNTNIQKDLADHYTQKSYAGILLSLRNLCDKNTIENKTHVLLKNSSHSKNIINFMKAYSIKMEKEEKTKISNCVDKYLPNLQ